MPTDPRVSWITLTLSLMTIFISNEQHIMGWHMYTQMQGWCNTDEECKYSTVTKAICHLQAKLLMCCYISITHRQNKSEWPTSGHQALICLLLTIVIWHLKLCFMPWSPNMRVLFNIHSKVTCEDKLNNVYLWNCLN